jgi:hypothetical protein
LDRELWLEKSVENVEASEEGQRCIPPTPLTGVRPDTALLSGPSPGCPNGPPPHKMHSKWF